MRRFIQPKIYITTYIYLKNIILSYINVISIRNKLDDLKLLGGKSLVIICFSETKLDETYQMAQFATEGLANFIVWMLYQTMEVSHFMLQLTCHANYICKNIWIFGDFNAIPENKSTSWIFKVCKTWLKTKFVLSQQTVLWLSISNDKQVSISKPNSFESPYSNRYGAYNNLWKISTKVTIVPKLRTFLEWLFYK